MLGLTEEKNYVATYSFDECRNAFYLPKGEIKEHRIFEGLPNRADFE